MKLFQIYFLIIGFVGCAGGPIATDNSAENLNNDLVETFELKGEQFEKFKVQDVPSAPVAEAKPIVPAPKELKRKLKTKKTNLQKSEKIAPAATQDIYPENYPDDYKRYDLASQKLWAGYRPLVFKDEEIQFTVKYLGVTAGYITLKTHSLVNIAGKEAFHYSAVLQSASFYEMIYKADDKIFTYLDRHTFLPIKYSLNQRESGQNVDDLQLFDSDQLKTYYWYKRIKKNKEKKEENNAFIPKYFQDSFSALFFVRGLPLKAGDFYEFPVLTRSKVWLLKVKVVGVEKIDVNGQEIEAIKLDAETHFPGVLKRNGDINFWYSNDEQKRLLKFNAKIKIGSISGEMTNYKNGSRIE